MLEHFPTVLGAIAAFCEGAGVTEVHLLQCDVGLTSDEFVEPEKLYDYSRPGRRQHMSPAMLHLAEDPEVEAAIVLTDGYIDFPPSAHAVRGPLGALRSIVGRVIQSRLRVDRPILTPP